MCLVTKLSTPTPHTHTHTHTHTLTDPTWVPECGGGPERDAILHSVHSDGRHRLSQEWLHHIPPLHTPQTQRGLRYQLVSMSCDYHINKLASVTCGNIFSYLLPLFLKPWTPSGLDSLIEAVVLLVLSEEAINWYGIPHDVSCIVNGPTSVPWYNVQHSVCV